MGLAYSLFQAECFRSWKQSWEINPSWSDSLSHQTDALLQRAALPRIPLERAVGSAFERGALAFTKHTRALAVTTNDQALHASAALHNTFLKCLQEKTNRQIVLKGALHLSDYVTKVMKRLSDHSVDPKVVLEFGFS